MSDSSQGEGWWLASDGKWYAPEQHPDYQPPASSTVAQAPPRPTGAEAAMGPGWWLASDGRWYPPQAAVPVQKKPVHKRVWFWLVTILAAIVILMVALLAVAGSAVDHAAHVDHTITYSVTGTGGPAESITYATVQEGNGQNGEAQVTDATVPWSKTITASGLFTVFDVNATVGRNGGSLTCLIIYDGRQVAGNTASGADASADCTYSP